MIRWIVLLGVIGILVAFLALYDFNNSKIKSNFNAEETSIIEIGQEFLDKTSIKDSAEKRILGDLREITEQEILKETEIPDLSDSEKIMNNGIKLSADYNQVSYEYSSEKITDSEYFAKLFDFEIKYEKYMTAVDAYIGEEDILVQKNSMLGELEKIKKQMTILKNSNIDANWEAITEYEKYKKHLPSMFVP